MHLFGNSLGGAVSTRVAADRSDLVRTLTLVSPALPNLRPKRGTDARLPLLLLPGVRAMASRQLARQSPEPRARVVLALCFADPSTIHPDRLVDVAIAPRAAATFPDVRLLVLDGVGHVAQMERPEVVARAFLGMLEQVGAGSAA